MGGGRRVRWGAAGLTVGVGAALVAGAGIASTGIAVADAGDSTSSSGRGSSTSSANPSAAKPSAANPSSANPSSANPSSAHPSAADAGSADPVDPPASGQAASPGKRRKSAASDRIVASPSKFDARRAESVAARETAVRSPGSVSDAVVADLPDIDFGAPPTGSLPTAENPGAGLATAALVRSAVGVAPAAAATSGQDVAAVPVSAAVRGNVPPANALLAAVVANLLSGLGMRDLTPSDDDGTAPTTATSAPLTNGVTGVKVSHSALTIPLAAVSTTGAPDFVTPADWYFPTQADGTVQANGVIWLQHGFMADKAYYSALATALAKQTNSIVVVPTISSLPLTCSDCWINSVAMERAAADMFTGGRAALNASAQAAGFDATLPNKFLMAGHSAGGGFAAAVAGFAVDIGVAAGDLLGVIMYDGVSLNGALSGALASLAAVDVPIYQIAAPPQMWNLFGLTTDELLGVGEGEFDGHVLVGGSHVDSMLGSNPFVDLVAQLVTQSSPSGNTQAVYTLSGGWINDMYVGAGPDDPRFGLYGAAAQQLIMGDATAIALPDLTVRVLSDVEVAFKSLIVTLMPLLVSSTGNATPISWANSVGHTGVTPPSAGGTNSAPGVPADSNGVTGVRVGHADLRLQVGLDDYAAPADWYFPTQADGSVEANGVIYLQHGFLGDKSYFSALATQLALQTNSIVVVPTLPSAATITEPDSYLMSPSMQKAVADLFVGDRAALSDSAAAAGFVGDLPRKYILAGHSYGGGLAATAGGYSVENGAAEGDLLGVVMFDGVSDNGTFAGAVADLSSAGIPIYQIAAPAQIWNQLGETTNQLDADDLAELRPGQFVGVVLENGSHFDAMIGGDPLADFLFQILSQFAPPGNTAATQTLAIGWINDMYAGKGPSDPGYGIYGDPGEVIRLGDATAVVLAPDSDAA